MRAGYANGSQTAAWLTSQRVTQLAKGRASIGYDALRHVNRQQAFAEDRRSAAPYRIQSVIVTIIIGVHRRDVEIAGTTTVMIHTTGLHLNIVCSEELRTTKQTGQLNPRVKTIFIHAVSASLPDSIAFSAGLPPSLEAIRVAAPHS
jgi:hypothetical protein